MYPPCINPDRLALRDRAAPDDDTIYLDLDYWAELESAEQRAELAYEVEVLDASG